MGQQAGKLGFHTSCVIAVATGCRPDAVAGVRVVHWPDQRWKPWCRRAGDPWARSVLDELWWDSREAALIAAQEELAHGAWREDGRCGPLYRNSFAGEGECDPTSEFACCNPSTGWCGHMPAHCFCKQCLHF